LYKILLDSRDLANTNIVIESQGQASWIEKSANYFDSAFCVAWYTLEQLARDCHCFCLLRLS